MPELSSAARHFVVHWGEMGTRWGINRTVAQIHALLWLSPEPLTAEEICETLLVARSNASTSLRELQSWELIRVTHVLGDRRDHFDAQKDPWEAFRLILEQRKKREIDPTLEALRSCLEEARGRRTEEVYARERMEELLEFFETMDSWYHQVAGLPVKQVKRFVKLGRRLRELL